MRNMYTLQQQAGSTVRQAGSTVGQHWQHWWNCAPTLKTNTSNATWKRSAIVAKMKSVKCFVENVPKTTYRTRQSESERGSKCKQKLRAQKRRRQSIKRRQMPTNARGGGYIGKLKDGKADCLPACCCLPALRNICHANRAPNKMLQSGVQLNAKYLTMQQCIKMTAEGEGKRGRERERER